MVRWHLSRNLIKRVSNLFRYLVAKKEMIEENFFELEKDLCFQIKWIDQA